MFSIKNIWAVWILVFVLAVSGGTLYALEHPQAKTKEHPGGSKKTTVTSADITKVIETFIKKQEALLGGYFLLYDKEAKQPLALSLVKIHSDKICQIEKDKCFACADFKTPDGKAYDLDLLVSHPSKNMIEVSEVSIHKEAGKERYGWVEEKGLWQKKPVGAEKASEHPATEHPK